MRRSLYSLNDESGSGAVGVNRRRRLPPACRYLLLFFLALTFMVSHHAAMTAEPALRDFRWEPVGDQLVLRVQFNHTPIVQVRDEHIQNRYYYLDFQREEGPAERQDWTINSKLVSHATRIYYPQQKVLRFVLYTPFRSDVRFVMSTRSDNSCVVTVAPIKPQELAPATSVPPAPGGPRRKLVVLDPGHGGNPPDPSIAQGTATSRRIDGRNYDEKDVVLDIANYLEAYLKQTPNMDCYMTRRTDTYVSLDQRIVLAKQARGDLFLSIHLNATSGRHKSARGFEIYYVSEKGTNKQLAALENDESLAEKNQALSGGGKLGELLRSLADDLFRQRQAESRNLCMVIDQEFLLKGPLRSYDRGVKAEAFRVLLNDSMPAALAECGFLDTPADAALLVRPDVQKKIAALFFNGINRYFATVDPEFVPHYVPVTH